MRNFFKRKEVIFFSAIVVILILSGVLVQPKKFVKSEQTVERKYVDPIIDLNKASIEELMTLTGIGPSKAKAIIEYREQKKFETIDEIMKVRGIGEKTFEKIKERLVVDGDKKLDSNEGKDEKIDINTAGIDELAKLPGIGPSKAKSIVDYREKHGKFRTYEDLLNVSGIGEKTLEKIKTLIILK